LKQLHVIFCIALLLISLFKQDISNFILANTPTEHTQTSSSDGQTDEMMWQTTTDTDFIHHSLPSISFQKFIHQPFDYYIGFLELNLTIKPLFKTVFLPSLHHILFRFIISAQAP